MKKVKYIFVAIVMAFVSIPMVAQKFENKDVEMFPQPNKGFKQVVIQVPTKKNENNLKVELFAGKQMEVDCNRHFMSGQIVEQNLEGWGYNYYKVESNGNVGSTRMACPDAKKKNEFVTMPSLLINYNSKLPIVIYVPQDLEVNYRVWKTDKKSKKAITNIVAPALDNPKVEDKKWQLVELNGKPIEGTSETHYIIFHSKDNRLEAKANCNVLSYNYEIVGEYRLKLTRGISTMMACPESVEDELVAVLNQVDNLSLGDDVLTLNKARMAPLAKFRLVK